MKKVVHFEIPYDDMHRVSGFYEKIFGWKIEEMPMEGMEYFMAHTGPTDKKGMPMEKGFINGGLMPKTNKVKGTVIAMQVDDIHKTIKMSEENGGEKIMDPMAVGDMGWYAYVKDSEGNTIGIWQDKEK